MFVALRFYGGILTILLDYIVNTDSWLIKRLLNRSSFNNCLGPDWLNYGFEVLCVTCVPIDYSISRAWSLAASDLPLSPALIVQRSRGRKAAQQPPPLTWNLTQVCFIRALPLLLVTPELEAMLGVRSRGTSYPSPWIWQSGTHGTTAPLAPLLGHHSGTNSKGACMHISGSSSFKKCWAIGLCLCRRIVLSFLHVFPWTCACPGSWWSWQGELVSVLGAPLTQPSHCSFVFAWFMVN